MKTIIALMLLVLVSCASVTEHKIEKPVIVGKFLWNEWKNQSKWKNNGSEDYSISNEKIELISSFLDLKKEKFMIFNGSWCGDSETEVPKIIKIFELIGITSDYYTLIGVDRAKREPEGIAEKFNIEKVPTLIILRNDKELGRIVEFPTITWEDDIFLILSKN